MRTDYKQSGVDRRDERNTKTPEPEVTPRKSKKKKVNKPYHLQQRYVGVKEDTYECFWRNGDWLTIAKFHKLEDANKMLTKERRGWEGYYKKFGPHYELRVKEIKE